MKVKTGDYIKILDTYGARWIEQGEIYRVEDHVNNSNRDLKVNGMWWSCESKCYSIVGSPSGESTFDQEALEKQQRRLLKENTLQRAAREYTAGTMFQSMSPCSTSMYIISEEPGYEWSENTEGVYAWAKDTDGMYFRTYICKRGDWAKIVTKDLMTEAKEKFSAGTRFTNSYGTTSVVADDPEYMTTDGFIYATCITGRWVRIHTGDKWCEIVTQPSSSDTTIRKPQNGDQVYITRYATGCIAKYKNQWVEVKEISYEQQYAFYMRFPDDDRYLVLKSEWSWTAPKQETPSISGFNVGDMVKVVKDDDYFYKGSIAKVESIHDIDGGMCVLMYSSLYSISLNIIASKLELVKPDSIESLQPEIDELKRTFEKVELPNDFIDMQEKYKDLFYLNLKTNKTQQNGTESTKSVKLQGVNFQIREGNINRGIGLKGSRSKIKLGSNNRYY